VTALYVAIGIVLVIVALVVRDQTEYRLNRLRGELLALRNEEQRLNEESNDLERMIAQTRDALMRANDRQRGAQKAHEEVIEMLADLGLTVDPVVEDESNLEKQDS
jgi:hypothetical protein